LIFDKSLDTAFIHGIDEEKEWPEIAHRKALHSSPRVDDIIAAVASKCSVTVKDSVQKECLCRNLAIYLTKTTDWTYEQTGQ